jgi:hypothetical protein
MVTVASQPPAQFDCGVSFDANFQPLDLCGVPNPFFYHSDYDDFGPYVAASYTSTATGTAVAAFAGTAGDGGLIAGTTGTAAGVLAIQRAIAGFTVNSLPKKVFWEMRLKLSAWASAGLTGTFGLIQSTATPGTVTDGVYFTLSAAGVLAINSAVGSVITSVAIPTAAYTTGANVTLDLAFAITRQGDVLAYVDTQLVGFVPQSNIGTTNGPQNAGAVARITAPTLTTANLCPTIGFTQAGSVAVVATVDFMGTFKER